MTRALSAKSSIMTRAPKSLFRGGVFAAVVHHDDLGCRQEVAQARQEVRKTDRLVARRQDDAERRQRACEGGGLIGKRGGHGSSIPEGLQSWGMA